MKTIDAAASFWHAVLSSMPYVSPGNRKMTLPTWSLPSCDSSICIGSTWLCRLSCYARKAEKAYPDVLPSRLRNLFASRDDGFVARMIPIVQRMAKKSGFFRIHESGDFYSQEYLDRWFEIIRQNPTIKFLAFTKSFELDFSKAPSNLQLVWSIYPDTDLASVPPGPRAYAGKFTARRRTVECPGGCDNCGMCWNLRTIQSDVHFNLH